MTISPIGKQYLNFMTISYWNAVFEMVTSNIKTGFPNGDCYCGSHESQINDEANMRLFAFYYKKLSPGEKDFYGIFP